MDHSRLKPHILDPWFCLPYSLDLPCVACWVWFSFGHGSKVATSRPNRNRKLKKKKEHPWNVCCGPFDLMSGGSQRHIPLPIRGRRPKIKSLSIFIDYAHKDGGGATVSGLPSSDTNILNQLDSLFVIFFFMGELSPCKKRKNRKIYTLYLWDQSSGGWVTPTRTARSRWIPSQLHRLPYFSSMWILKYIRKSKSLFRNEILHWKKD